MITVGDRVKLTATLPYLTMTSRLGTIVKDDGDGYFVIELDEPATLAGRTAPMSRLIEHSTSFQLVRR
ncbi:MAG: hypothetical protein M3440_03395 [Chloroflexota bacterium]|nr:hypothetical protein [Chloroflexota bacterium]